MRATKAILILTGVLFLLFNPVSSKADTITFDLNYVFSGTTPSGSPPWLKAKFDDGGGTGSVTLTLTGYLGSQFVSEWDFNFNDSLNLNELGIIQSSGPSATITKDKNNVKADGDGKFDIGLGFDTSEGGNRFDDGDVAVFTLSLAGITANSFDFKSDTGGGEGVYHTGAHIQGIPPIPPATKTESGWIGDGVPVPEPGILILLGIAMSAIGAASWKISKL
jgi:hypothetical protein